MAESAFPSLNWTIPRRKHYNCSTDAFQSFTALSKQGNKPYQRGGKPALKSVQRKYPLVQSTNGSRDWARCRAALGAKKSTVKQWPGIKPQRNHINPCIPAAKKKQASKRRSIDNGRHPASVRPTRKAAFRVRTPNLQSKST